MAEKLRRKYMNPILILGIIAAAFLLWLLCSFLYRPIGKLFARLVNDAKEAIEETDNEKGE